MKSQAADMPLYIRFLAKCSLVIGIPIFTWALYLFSLYPVNSTTISQRLAFGVALIGVGLIVLWCVPGPSSRDPLLRNGSTFIGSRVDGLLLYVSFLALPVLIFFTLGSFSSYSIARSSDADCFGVKVRVDTIDLKHISQEQLPNESFYSIYKEVYFIPELYKDLWVASGAVTLIEKEGKPVEPSRLNANFTIPNRIGYGSGDGRRTYIEHYKMDAVMDSERFDVGRIYQGWLLRDQPTDVFFVRTSDLAMKDVSILVSLTSAIVVYLVTRIRIGMKHQDKHWRDIKEIWNSGSRDSNRNLVARAKK